MDEKQPMQEKVNIDVNSLTRLAIYLEGIIAGKGNLNPLGTITVENLWHTIKYLQGDDRYKCEKL